MTLHGLQCVRPKTQGESQSAPIPDLPRQRFGSLRRFMRAPGACGEPRFRVVQKGRELSPGGGKKPGPPCGGPGTK